MRKKTAALLILVLVVSAAALSFGEASPSVIQRAIAFLSDDRPTGFHFTLRIGKSPVFGEERTEQLNNLLKHFAFDGTVDANLSEMTVSLDQQKLFGISQTYLSGMEMSCLYPADGDPCVIPAAFEPETDLHVSDSYLREKSIYQSLKNYHTLISLLPDAFPEKTGSTKILEKYRYYGTATKRVTVNLTGEELNEFMLTHRNEYIENALFPDPSDYVFENRQGFTLLLTEDNQVIGITYSGKIRIQEDDLREVRLDWKTVQTDTLSKNELTLRTPNTDRTRRDNYILDSQWSREEDGSETFRWNAETDLLADALRTQNKVTSEWTAADGHLSGQYSETNLSDRSHPTRTFLADAVVSDSSEYNGTLEIIDKNDKIETSRFLIGFELFSAVSEPVAASQPEIQTVSPDEYQAIRDSVESFILRELIRLPEEDLLFIKEGLPENAWNQLLLMNESGKEPAQ